MRCWNQSLLPPSRSLLEDDAPLFRLELEVGHYDTLQVEAVAGVSDMMVEDQLRMERIVERVEDDEVPPSVPAAVASVVVAAVELTGDPKWRWASDGYLMEFQLALLLSDQEQMVFEDHC